MDAVSFGGGHGGDGERAGVPGLERGGASGGAAVRGGEVVCGGIEMTWIS